MPVLEQEAGAVEIQRVTAFAAGELRQAPAPQCIEDRKIGRRSTEAAKEAGEHGLAGQAWGIEQLGI